LNCAIPLAFALAIPGTLWVYVDLAEFLTASGFTTQRAEFAAGITTLILVTVLAYGLAHLLRLSPTRQNPEKYHLYKNGHLLLVLLNIAALGTSVVPLLVGILRGDDSGLLAFAFILVIPVLITLWPVGIAMVWLSGSKKEFTEKNA
jgi:hypothetical protein